LSKLDATYKPEDGSIIEKYEPGEVIHDLLLAPCKVQIVTDEHGKVSYNTLYRLNISLFILEIR